MKIVFLWFVGHVKMSSGSTSSWHTNGDVGEFYFDDVLNTNLCRENHMRLQSTLNLDSSSSPAVVQEMSDIDSPLPISNSSKHHSSRLNRTHEGSGDTTPVSDGSRNKFRETMSTDRNSSQFWNFSFACKLE